MQNETSLGNEMRTEADVVDNTDYLEAIKTLKQNSVERSKYDALRAENKRLLDSLVNGQVAESTTEPVSKVTKESIQKLREELFNSENLTNLEYVTKALELRDSLISIGEDDPFVPHGTKLSVTNQDYEIAEKVAQGLKEMVLEADGNSEVFLNEYQRKVKDSAPHLNIKKK